MLSLLGGGCCFFSEYPIGEDSLCKTESESESESERERERERESEREGKKLDKIRRGSNDLNTELSAILRALTSGVFERRRCVSPIQRERNENEIYGLNREPADSDSAAESKGRKMDGGKLNRM